MNVMAKSKRNKVVIWIMASPIAPFFPQSQSFSLVVFASSVVVFKVPVVVVVISSVVVVSSVLVGSMHPRFC
jgi:hypothetical protein